MIQIDTSMFLSNCNDCLLFRSRNTTNTYAFIGIVLYYLLPSRTQFFKPDHHQPIQEKSHRISVTATLNSSTSPRDRKPYRTSFLIYINRPKY